jgi:hypothetical protein
VPQDIKGSIFFVKTVSLKGTGSSNESGDYENTIRK